MKNMMIYTNENEILCSYDWFKDQYNREMLAAREARTAKRIRRRQYKAMLKIQKALGILMILLTALVIPAMDYDITGAVIMWAVALGLVFSKHIIIK